MSPGNYSFSIIELTHQPNSPTSSSAGICAAIATGLTDGVSIDSTTSQLLLKSSNVHGTYPDSVASAGAPVAVIPSTVKIIAVVFS